jgi:HK97 family phage prohead protease
MRGIGMELLQKSAPVAIKADGGDGIVEALVATYDIDSGGDRIMPGAFAKTLQEWQDSGQPIPFIWSHQHDDIDAYLGDVLEAEERAPADDSPGGLWIKAQMDIEDAKTAKAYRMLKGGRVRNYSFAYDIRDAGPSEDDENVQELRELGLFEVGPTLIGMNRETRTLSVKTTNPLSPQDFRQLKLQVDDPGLLPHMKVGRVLSASTEQKLRDALAAVADVLAQLDTDDESSEEGKSHTTEPVKTEESAAPTGQTQTKADEPMPRGPDDDLDLMLDLLERS